MPHEAGFAASHVGGDDGCHRDMVCLVEVFVDGCLQTSIINISSRMPLPNNFQEDQC